MAQKKETAKKEVNVRDLAPKKDAKGGAGRRFSVAGGTRSAAGGLRSADGSVRSANAGNQNLS